MVLSHYEVESVRLSHQSFLWENRTSHIELAEVCWSGYPGHTAGSWLVLPQAVED
jgi:hypothetical protein